jgi:hypothetical protein
MEVENVELASGMLWVGSGLGKANCRSLGIRS